MIDKPKIGVGCGVMILRNSTVLLGLRHVDPAKATSLLNGAGTWTMPGGKIDFGESFIEAAKRETLEECGLILANPKVTCVNNDQVEGVQFVTIGLIDEDVQGEPKVCEPDKITKWRWFPLNELPSPLYFPSKKVFECYRNNTITADENKVLDSIEDKVQNTLKS